MTAGTSRLTVALTPQASDDLQRLQDRSPGQSQTELVNRAIRLREFADSQHGDGRDLLVRDPETGETQLVQLL